MLHILKCQQKSLHITGFKHWIWIYGNKTTRHILHLQNTLIFLRDYCVNKNKKQPECGANQSKTMSYFTDILHSHHPNCAKTLLFTRNVTHTDQSSSCTTTSHRLETHNLKSATLHQQDVQPASIHWQYEDTCTTLILDCCKATRTERELCCSTFSSCNALYKQYANKKKETEAVLQSGFVIVCRQQCMKLKSRDKPTGHGSLPHFIQINSKFPWENENIRFCSFIQDSCMKIKVIQTTSKCRVQKCLSSYQVSKQSANV